MTPTHLRAEAEAVQQEMYGDDAPNRPPCTRAALLIGAADSLDVMATVMEANQNMGSLLCLIHHYGGIAQARDSAVRAGKYEEALELRRAMDTVAPKQEAPDGGF